MARHKWRSCNKFGITDFFSVPAVRVGPLLKSTGATRIQGLLSIAVLQQHSILDLHTAEALHQSGDSTVDAADPRHKVAAPDHSIQHTPPASSSAGLRGTGTSLRAYCCTRVLATNEGEFYSQMYLHSATYLNLVNAEF